MTMQQNTVDSGKAKSDRLNFTRDELIDLHWVQGLSMTDIGRQNGVTTQAIKYWMIKLDIVHRSQLQDVLFESSPTLSYVFGVLHGDGFLYKNPNGYKYEIIMSVIDREFADSFSIALNRLGIRTGIISIAAKGKDKAQWKVCANSKQFHKLWNSLSTQERLDLGLTFDRDFIRGVYESEGSVRLHRGSLEMAIYSTNIAMLHRIESCMCEKGYAPKWFERVLDSGKPFGMLNLYRQLEIKRFIAWISPCIKFQPRGYVNSEPSQDGDILEGLETTKDS